MELNSIFFDADGLVRSGWRFLVFACAFVFLAVACEVAIWLALGPGAVNGAGSTALFLIVLGLAFLLSALVTGWACNRFFDRRPFRDLGASFAPGWLRHFALGLVTGAITLSLAVAVAMLFGGFSFVSDPVDWAAVTRTFWLSLVVFAVGAAWEEALFRGYPLQTFFHSRQTWFGIFFTALLFATIHVGNPSSDLLSWINTFIAGVWFAVGYLWSRDLWLPFGMHLMWNWMQGAFFGIEVSGLTDITSAPLLKEIDRGPAWLTGEAYGIEAGVACTAALIISTLAIYFFASRRRATVAGEPAADQRSDRLNFE